MSPPTPTPPSPPPDDLNDPTIDPTNEPAAYPRDTPDTPDTPDAPDVPEHSETVARGELEDAPPADPAERAAGEEPAAPPPPPARVRMETSAGSMLLEMLEDVAPRTAAHFLQLVHDGFYDGRSFHRIVPDFIVQGGCPYHDGTGGCGYTINPEFNDTPHEKGVVSMARTADPYSASSQFFICLSRKNCEHLDGQYTAFARVVDGLDVLDTLADTPLTNYELGTPTDPPMIYHVYREDDPYAHYHDDQTQETAPPAPDDAPTPPETPESP